MGVRYRYAQFYVARIRSHTGSNFLNGGQDVPYYNHGYTTEKRDIIPGDSRWYVPGLEPFGFQKSTRAERRLQERKGDSNLSAASLVDFRIKFLHSLFQLKLIPNSRATSLRHLTYSAPFFAFTTRTPSTVATRSTPQQSQQQVDTMDASAPTPRVNGSQLRQHMGQRVLLVGEVLNAGEGDMLRVMAGRQGPDHREGARALAADDKVRRGSVHRRERRHRDSGPAVRLRG